MCSKTCSKLVPPRLDAQQSIQQVGVSHHRSEVRKWSAKSFSTSASKHPTHCDSESHSRHSDLEELELSPTLEPRLLLLGPFFWGGGCFNNGQHTTAWKTRAALLWTLKLMMPTRLPSVDSNSTESQDNTRPQNDPSYEQSVSASLKYKGASRGVAAALLINLSPGPNVSDCESSYFFWV